MNKRKLLFLLFSIILLSANSFALTLPEPLVKYLFNETGTEALNSGASSAPLKLYTIDGLTDLHSDSGLGVSGLPGDRAFDNSPATRMGSQGTGHGRGVTDADGIQLLGGTKDFVTVQGWFKADTILYAGAVIMFIPGMVDVRQTTGTRGVIRFMSDDTKLPSADSPAVYNKTGEWVFFAVTWDGTKETDNVHFYIGDRTTPVQLGGTATFAHPMKPKEVPLPLIIGDTNAGMPDKTFTRPFDGYLDNLRIYGASDASAILSLEQLEFLRKIDGKAIPADKDKSIVDISTNQALANGVAEIPLTITAKDEHGNPLEGYLVSIAKEDGSGDLEFQTIEATTNSDGQAFFSLKSIKSGTANLMVSIIPGVGETVVLEEKPTIQFIQTINPANCKFNVDQAIVSADDHSYKKVEVLIKDYDQKPIMNQEVTLSLPAELNASESSKTTDEEGRAEFKIKAAASLEHIESEITVSFGQHSLTETLRFDGRLKVESDGAPFSSISAKRVLAPGLKTGNISGEKIPTDGVSYWEITTKLVGDEVEGRKVTSVAKSAADGISITPSVGYSTAEGQVVFTVSSTNPVLTTLDLEIAVENDAYAIWNEELQFVSDVEVGLYVIEAELDINNPFKIKFNKDVQLSEGAEIALNPNPELGDVYGNGIRDHLWEVEDSNIIIWTHDPLYANLDYTVTLTGIKALNDIVMIPFTFTFSGIDTDEPYIISMKPNPWAVDVSIDSQVRFEFSENLKLGNGKPQSLKIVVKTDDSEVVIAPSEYEYIPIDLDLGRMYSEVSFSYPFVENETYTIRVSDAVDYGNLVMEPVSWKFSTVSTLKEVRVVHIELSRNERGVVTTNPDIEIYFNQKVDASNNPKIVLTDKKNDINVPGIIQFIQDSGNTGLIFVPSNPLGNDGIYEVTLEDVVSESGYAVGEFSYTFVTEVKDISSPIGDGEIHVLNLPLQDEGETTITVHLPKKSGYEISKLKAYNIHDSVRGDLNTKLYSDNLALTSSIYEIQAFDDEGKMITGKLLNPMSITFAIVEEEPGFVKDLNDTLVPVDSLRSYWWDNVRNEWIPVGGVIDNTKENITWTVDRFGIFSLIGTTNEAKSFLSEVILTTNPLIRSNNARGETTFKFRLAHDSKITITLYDPTGRQVATIIEDAYFPAGYNGILWDGSVGGLRLKPGVYVYKLYAASQDLVQPNYTWESGTIGIF